MEELMRASFPLVQLVPVDRVSFPIFSWEKEALESAAKEKGIDALFRPLRGIYDTPTGKTVLVSYFIDSDECPFLLENLCMAYDRRPLVCRMFPFNSGPKSSEKVEYASFCPGCKEIQTINLPAMHEFFGENLTNAIQNDLVVEKVNRLIIGLMRDGHVKPALNYPPQQVLRMMLKSEKMDLFDFVREKGIMTEAQISEFIDEANDTGLGRGMLKGLLGKEK